MLFLDLTVVDLRRLKALLKTRPATAQRNMDESMSTPSPTAQSSVQWRRRVLLGRPRPIGKGWRRRRLTWSLPSQAPGARFVVGVWIWFRSKEAILEQTRLSCYWDLWQRSANITSSHYTDNAAGAQLQLNAVLGSQNLKAATTFEAVSYFRVKVRSADHSITKSFLTSIRKQDAHMARKSLRLARLQQIIGIPGMAEIWWADLRPDLLGAVDTPAFKKLVDCQITKDRSTSDLADESMPEDPYANTLREFLSRLSDARSRESIIQLMANFNQIVPAPISHADQLGPSSSRLVE
jgi:hypothetical protein